MAGTLFWLAMSAATWRMRITSDFGQHASAIERITADWLIRPIRCSTSPTSAARGPAARTSRPYTVVLGLVAKATGLAGWQVLKACGPFNLALVITGVGAFTRTLSRRRWAPVLALAAYVLLWGPVFKEWSGFLGMQSMTRGLTYPSAFAIGLTFHAWALTGRLTRRGVALAPYAGLGLLTGVVLIVHPFTAMAAVIGIVSLITGWQHGWTRAVALRWALTAAVALAVAALWPYFSVFSLAGDPTVDGVHRHLYSDLWAWYGLTLAGLPALLWRLRRNRPLDPLVLMFVLDCAVAAYGWFSGHYTYGRIFALLPVPPQFALAVELAGIPPWTLPRKVLAPIAAVAAYCGLLAQGGAIVPQRFEPFPMQRVVRWPSYHWAADHIPVGDVVLTDGYRPMHVMPAYGGFLVAPTWPDPSTSAEERQRRWADLRAYLAPSATPARQRRIAHRYHVRWVITGAGRPTPADGTLVAIGPVTHERLFRLARGTPTAFGVSPPPGRRLMGAPPGGLSPSGSAGPPTRTESGGEARGR